MRTLVISDLHLGLRSGRDRLRADPDVRARLCEALAGADRLVLLGDAVELREQPIAAALDAALPVLAELAGALARRAGEPEVVLVPGNHDHALLAPWFARRALDPLTAPLGLESEADHRPGEPLALLAAALAPATLRVAYPGVWLSPSVYAHHGHYLDAMTTVPTIERLSLGLTSLLLRRPRADASGAEQFEAVLAPVYAWLRAAAERGAAASETPRRETSSVSIWRQLQPGSREGGMRGRALRLGFPPLIAGLARAGLGPLESGIAAETLRTGSLAAMRRALGAPGTATGLGVGADWVLFGHTHRAGPLPGDDGAEWRTDAGGRLINVGCWVHEPQFTAAGIPGNPYRGGFAATLEDAGPPELVEILG